MKKILWMVFLFFLFIPIGKASSAVEVKWMKEVFANQTYQGVKYYAQLGYIYIDGKIGFCIEPGVAINQNFYEGTHDFSSLSLSEEQKKELELIAYYGYQYPGHQTREYYMATQELVWRIVGTSDVYFTTRSQYRGEVISVEKEKQEISDLILQHQKLPSFNNLVLEEKIGEKIQLRDANQVLEDYTLTGENVEFERQGNNIFITTSMLGTGTISFKQLLYESFPSTIFYRPGSQTLIQLGNQKPLSGYLTIHTRKNENELCITKLDQDTGQPILEPGAQFKLSNVETNEQVGELISLTGNLCQMIDLPLGKYKLEEIESPIGYIKDPKPYFFTVTEATNQLEIQILNQKIEMPKTGYTVKKGTMEVCAIILGVTSYFIFSILKKN